MGQLHRHEGARERLSSAVWLDPDKAHRILGGRLAQQVAKVVTYDTEYGFGLLEKVVTPPVSLEPSRGDRNCTLQRTSAEQAEALTLFVASADAPMRIKPSAQESHGSIEVTGGQGPRHWVDT